MAHFGKVVDDIELLYTADGNVKKLYNHFGK